MRAAHSLACRLLALTALAWQVAGVREARADLPTVGWEWEVLPWKWVVVDSNDSVVYQDGKQVPCPDALIATKEASPVKNSIPLVALTRDLGNKLEIVTGPFAYNDADTVNRIMSVVRGMKHATKRRAKGKLKTVSIPALIEEMNRYAKSNGLTWEVAPHPKFVAGKNECKLQLVKRDVYNYDMNTQTNLGLSLDVIGDGLLDNLYSSHTPINNGYGVAKRAYDAALARMNDRDAFLNLDLAQIEDAKAKRELQGLIALLSAVANAETFSAWYRGRIGTSWRGWESKTVQELYLKTSPRELVQFYRDANPAIAKLLDGLDVPTPIEGGGVDAYNELKDRYCVAQAEGAVPLDCMPRLTALVRLLRAPNTSDEDAMMNPIPKPIPIEKYADKWLLVLEVRHPNSTDRHPIDTASDLVRVSVGKGKGTIRLKDYAFLCATLRKLYTDNKDWETDEFEMVESKELTPPESTPIPPPPPPMF